MTNKATYDEKKSTSLKMTQEEIAGMKRNPVMTLFHRNGR